MSVEYLRIDAICIQQDSPDDWARESALMRDVYSNSICTIAAAASKNSDGGLFRKRAPREIVPGLVKGSWPNFPSGDYVIVEEFYWDLHVDSLSIACLCTRVDGHSRNVYCRLGFYILRRNRLTGSVSRNVNAKDSSLHT